MATLPLGRFRRRLVPLSFAAAAVTTLVAPATVALVLELTDRDVEAHLSQLLGVSIAGAAMGAVIGFAIYVVPMRMIRQQAGQVSRAIEKEIAATQELTALNKMLSQKVADAVAEARGLSETMLEMQETERRRIARELHDGVGQALTALQLEIDVSRSRPESGPKHLEEAARICQEVMAAIRQAVYDLRPPEIGRTPLEDIFRSYAERFEARSQIATSVRWRGGSIESEPLATCLLRILQEAFTNISRYAHAKEVGISVEVGDNEIVMQIQDDGVGFDPDTVDALKRPGKGSGLRGMKERCAFFGGVCDVRSAPGEGCQLRVRLPKRRVS